MLRASYRCLLVCMLNAAAAMLLADAVLAQDLASTRFPISEADVAKTLTSVGVNVSASAVHLPLQMIASTPAAQLEIVAMKPIADHQLHLELRCHAPSECIPFIATVDVPDSKRIAADVRTTTDLAAASNNRSINGESRTMAVTGGHTSLRAGTRAVLQIRDGHLDIHLQVLAIDSGSVGEQVRVSTLDHKKIFHATVTGEGTVTGVME